MEQTIEKLAKAVLASELPTIVRHFGGRIKHDPAKVLDIISNEIKKEDILYEVFSEVFNLINNPVAQELLEEIIRYECTLMKGCSEKYLAELNKEFCASLTPLNAIETSKKSLELFKESPSVEEPSEVPFKAIELLRRVVNDKLMLEALETKIRNKSKEIASLLSERLFELLKRWEKDVKKKEIQELIEDFMNSVELRKTISVATQFMLCLMIWAYLSPYTSLFRYPSSPTDKREDVKNVESPYEIFGEDHLFVKKYWEFYETCKDLVNNLEGILW